MANLRLEVETTGPFFTGQYQKELHAFLDEAKAEVAQLGVDRIRQRIGARAKDPSGYYAAHIQTELVKPFNDQLITDGGVRYGPWLEGTSSRNATTRFKGYHIFRQTRAWLRKTATPIFQSRINEFVNRMNG